MPVGSIARCGGSTTSFTEAVFQVAATNLLLAYWKLGEGATPYADTSGHNPSAPATQVLQANSTAMTQDFSPDPFASTDCGSVAFNVDDWAGSFSPSEYLFANTSDNRFDVKPMSITTFVRLFSGTAAKNGGITGNISMAAGSPDYRVGMGFYARTNTRVVTFTNGQHTSGGTLKNIDTPAGLVADTWYFLAGTWDGTTLTFYVDGSSVGTLADSGSTYTLNNGWYIGRMNINGTYGACYGAVGTTTVWGSALSASDVGVLAAAAGF